MQEGTPAFLGMVKISAAVAQFKAAGLPYVVYLRHPTTGGVLASWGSLGHVTVAEPGAMIGFLGARVYEALYGRPFPDGVQVAENLHARGIVDAVVPVERLAEMAARTLSVLDARHTDHPPVPAPVSRPRPVCRSGTTQRRLGVDPAVAPHRPAGRQDLAQAWGVRRIAAAGHRPG